jgi:hypothetical protein
MNYNNSKNWLYNNNDGYIIVSKKRCKKTLDLIKTLSQLRCKYFIIDYTKKFKKQNPKFKEFLKSVSNNNICYPMVFHKLAYMQPDNLHLDIAVIVRKECKKTELIMEIQWKLISIYKKCNKKFNRLYIHNQEKYRFFGNVDINNLDDYIENLKVSHINIPKEEEDIKKLYDYVLKLSRDIDDFEKYYGNIFM